MSGKKSVAIIGAGAGGLSAAALLSRDFNVNVYERAKEPGGKIRQEQIGNHFIDAGPTVFTMPWVFQEIFKAAGTTLENELAIKKLDVLARHAWLDGSNLDLYADQNKSAEAIAKFSGSEDSINFRKFCKRAEGIFQTLRDPFMRQCKPSMLSLLAKRSPVSLLGIDPFRTLWQSLSKQFNDPRLTQLFARYATYCGSSPYSAPATLMLIAHVEQDGVWTIDGGMKALALALAKVAEENGTEFHYEKHAINIKATKNNVEGIEFSDGTHVQADIIIYNGDPAALNTGLVGRDTMNSVKLPQRVIRSQSAMTWAMLAKPDGFDLSTHTVFFSNNYRREFDDVFARKKVPKQPTVYIFAPDRETPSGCRSNDHDAERIFCLINAPSINDTISYNKEETDKCRMTMFDHLQNFGLKLNPIPKQLTETTPQDYATRFPGTNGALYGMASHGWMASFQRPGVRTSTPGLYLTGGGAHPGAGVPMAALSGTSAARAIIEDFASM